MSSEAFKVFLTEQLVHWREALLQELYGDTISITAESIMGNEIIQKIAAERNRIRTEADLKSRVRWMLGGVRPGPGEVGELGKALLAELIEIYKEYDVAQSRALEEKDDEEEEEEEDRVEMAQD